MVARKPQNPAPEIRTSRLVLEGPDGREQATLEPGEHGPTLRLLDPQTGSERLVVTVVADGSTIRLDSPQGRPRAIIASNPVGAKISLYSNKWEERELGGPLARLETNEDACLLALDGIGEYCDGSLDREPRVLLANYTSGGGSTWMSGHIEVFDKEGDLSFEAPRTRSGFATRLQGELAAAAVDMARREALEINGDDLARALREAAELAEAELRAAGRSSGA